MNNEICCRNEIRFNERLSIFIFNQLSLANVFHKVLNEKGIFCGLSFCWWIFIFICFCYFFFVIILVWFCLLKLWFELVSFFAEFLNGCSLWEKEGKYGWIVTTEKTNEKDALWGRSNVWEVSRLRTTEIKFCYWIIKKVMD